MKFGAFDAEGFPLAFYSDDIHTDIPAEAVQITDEQWSEFINNQGLRRWVNGEVVVYDPPAPEPVAQRIEWGSLIRAMTNEEASAFDAAVQAADARFRWLIQKTAYIATDDPDYPTLKAAFDAAYGQERSDELLPPPA